MFQSFEGGPPLILKQEPEDGPRNMQKVPSLSDLSDQEASLGKCNYNFMYCIILQQESKQVFQK